MSDQNYKNHRRFYPLHHFLLYPIIVFLLVISASSDIYENEILFRTIICAGLFLTGWLSLMTRQHYALTIQNRTIRLELRLRYFQLTGNRLEVWEDRLSIGQLVSLRFASDDELPALIERAAEQNLSADEVKKSIIHWLPDEMRV